MAIEKAYGQLCWTLEDFDKKVYVTIQGGNLTCDFETRNGTVNPFYVFPWWSEPGNLELDNLSQVMRGDFFCFPFGADDNKEPVTYHGPTASGYWEPASEPASTVSGDSSSIDLQVQLDMGTVTKHVELRSGEPVVYQRHTVSGFDGVVPFGYHPLIRFPEGLGTGRITISDPLSGYTTPESIELPEDGGYSRIKPASEITDMSAVPCTDGSSLDLTTFPHTSGHEELVMFVSNPDLPFAFSAVSFPEEGYLYFQLKNPRTLRQTILWMSNGGRWYAPWNGRIRGLLGLEEVTSFFHYGMSASAGKNFLSDKGIPTAREFTAAENVGIPLIAGVAPITPSFGRVRSIERSGDAGVTIFGEDNQELQVPCDLEFLA